jgi:RNA ligase (TIGR02306 family)
MDRKLASIQQVIDLQPIPGADAILVASVLGWKCVVKKTEFKIGDLCVYFEIDSILPIAQWNDHLRKEPMKPLRVRTIRLRGQLSQGLALPMSLLPESNYEIGQDVTEVIGVKKYEPYIPPELVGKVKGTRPSWIPKTDEPRLQSSPDALAELLSLNCTVVGTMKMDGTSFTAYLKDGVFGVCSRNMELIETEGNAYWKAIREADLEKKMRDYFPWQGGNYAVQGELCGPGIQGNRMGLLKPEIYLYNVWHIDHAVYLSCKILNDFCLSKYINMVRVVFYGILSSDTTVDKLLHVANELNYSNGLPAEGIVWRPLYEETSQILKGRMSFKTVSNRFLEKYKE